MVTHSEQPLSKNCFVLTQPGHGWATGTLACFEYRFEQDGNW